MLLQPKQTIIDYLNQFGYLFEDSIILEEEIKVVEKEEKINRYYNQKKKDLEKKKKEVLQKIDSNKEKYKESLKDFGEDLRDKIFDELEVEIDEKRSRVRQYFVARRAMLTKQQETALKTAKKGGLLIAGTTLASLLIYSSIKLYKKDQESFKEQCKQLEDKEKRKCIIRARIILLKKRSQFLKTVLTRCKESKDPVACKNKIDLELLKIQGKIQDFLNEVGGKIV